MASDDEGNGAPCELVVECAEIVDILRSHFAAAGGPVGQFTRQFFGYAIPGEIFTALFVKLLRQV